MNIDLLKEKIDKTISFYLLENKKNDDNTLSYIPTENEFMNILNSEQIQSLKEVSFLDDKDFDILFVNSMIDISMYFNTLVLDGIKENFAVSKHLDIFQSIFKLKYGYILDLQDFSQFYSSSLYNKYFSTVIIIECVNNLELGEVNFTPFFIIKVGLDVLDRNNDFLITALATPSDKLFNLFKYFLVKGLKINKSENEIFKDSFRGICLNVRKDRLDFFYDLFPWGKSVVDEETLKLVRNSTKNYFK